MRRWVAKYNLNDDPFEEEVRISIEGTEYGFVGMAENGDELDLIPADTMEDALDEIDYHFAGYDTFAWLDKEES